VREIIVVAGEASGDLHAGAVAARLKVRRPDLAVAGVGGAHLREAGAEIVTDHGALAVMGFAEVLKHIPTHAALLRRLTARMESHDVRAVMLVDYPGFNMKVAAAARARGIPVVYYITPQVWAWGARRLPKLARLVTKAAVILPFEEALLRGYGIDATFVGHPLLDRTGGLVSQAEARRRLGLPAPAESEVLALFPGSRAQEIARHTEDFVRIAQRAVAARPSLRVVVAAAPGVTLDASRIPFPVVRADSFDILRAADVALCKSGTTTLEAAVAGCPLAVAYRTGRVSYAIARRVVRIPYIGLVNVVAGREVAREFVQDALQPVPVAAELERLLGDAPYRAEVQAGLAEVRARLGTPGASERVAAMLDTIAG